MKQRVKTTVAKQTPKWVHELRPSVLGAKVLVHWRKDVEEEALVLRWQPLVEKAEHGATVQEL